MPQDLIVALFLFPILSILFGYYAFICWFRVDQFHRIIENNSKWYRRFSGSFSIWLLKWLKSGSNLFIARILATLAFILTLGMSISVIVTLFIALFT